MSATGPFTDTAHARDEQCEAPVVDEFSWAVGFFEGEGCISITRYRNVHIADGYHRSLSVTSTDRDNIERFQAAVQRRNAARSSAAEQHVPTCTRREAGERGYVIACSCGWSRTTSERRRYALDLHREHVRNAEHGIGIGEAR